VYLWHTALKWGPGDRRDTDVSSTTDMRTYAPVQSVTVTTASAVLVEGIVTGSPRTGPAKHATELSAFNSCRLAYHINEDQ